jgi:hypothetical protein
MTAHSGFFWAPRVLAALVCVFLSLFALDAFAGSKSLAEALRDFLWHLVPVGVLAIFVALAWRRPIVGAVAFLVAGTLYVWFAWAHPSWILVISGPLWLVGLLFLLSPRARR